MYRMQRRYPACEHNVKRLRTCTTSVSRYPVLLTAEVPSLLELCAHSICGHVNACRILSWIAQHNSFSNHLVQLLLHYMTDEELLLMLTTGDSFICMPTHSDMRELCLAKRHVHGMSSSGRQCDIVESLSHHKLQAVTMSESDLQQDTLESLVVYQPGLKHLDLSFCLCVERFDSVFAFKELTYLNLERTDFKLTATTAHSFFALKNLRWLGLSKLLKHSSSFPLQIQMLNSVTSELRGLDLSETIWNVSQHANLLHFKKLEYLDISHYPTSGSDPVKFDEVIEQTLVNMPTLSSLDVSGCLLQEQDKIYKLKLLELDFLGIVGDDFYYIQDVDNLATRVASHRKLEHILVLLHKYKNNVGVLEQALKNLFTLHRNRIDLGYSSAHIEPQLFEAVLCTLERFPLGDKIQQIASACLFTLNSGNDRAVILSEGVEPYPGYDKHVRRAIILLLISVNIHTSSWDVLRNCIGMLSQFCAYQRDFMFYEIIHSLILVLEKQRGVLERSTVLSIEDSLRDRARQISTLTVRNINASICQSACSKKRTVGRMRLIETILDISQLAFSLFKQGPHEGESLEFGALLVETWSTLWNITDEQAGNCDRFVEHGGLELYLDTYNICSQVRTDDRQVAVAITTLIRNMLGLMGNIAEVPHIRPALLQDNIVRSFHALRHYDKLYENECDIIEIKYSAAGILSHICSDGIDKWVIRDEELTYETVLDGIVEAVESWDITSKRSINYKSFNPILHIIRVECPFPCKLWAVWALTNLCESKPKRFVPMLRRDGGVELLNKLIESPGCPDNILRLCDLTLAKAYDPNIGSDIEET